MEQRGDSGERVESKGLQTAMAERAAGGEVPRIGEIPNGENLDTAFQALVERWRRDNRLISSAHKMVLHPAYQRIIGKGPAVIPLILRELQARPDHWFWALHAITGEDPAPPEANFDSAVLAWLEWGRARGYLPR